MVMAVYEYEEKTSKRSLVTMLNPGPRPLRDEKPIIPTRAMAKPIGMRSKKRMTIKIVRTMARVTGFIWPPS
jgi:hypothetical protein